MKRTVAFVSLLVICLSCGVLKPKYITQIQHDTTTIYQNNNVYLHDSVYVFKDRYIYTKGDTVFNNVTEYRDRWKIKEVHDTTIKERAVFVDREVPVEIEKPLTIRQKFLILLGKISAVVLLVGVGYMLLKVFGK